jgi:hypothetical protein
MKLMQWTVPVVYLFCISGAAAEEPSDTLPTKTDTPTVELKYQFSEGDEWHYSLTEKGTQTAVSPGLTRSARNNSSQTKHYRVVHIEDDGAAIVEVILDRYQIDFTVKNTPETGKSQETRLAYDTANDKAPPRGLEGIKTSIGKPFARFRMSPAGNITELEFLQAAQPQALKQAEQTKGLPIAFPAGPIPTGRSWSESTPIDLQVDSDNPKLKRTFHVRTIYQLKSVEDGIAEISISTIIQPRLTDPRLLGEMMSYLPTGTIRFDTTQGRIISRTELIDRRELGVGGPKTALTIENRKEETLIAPDRQGLAN